MKNIDQEAVSYQIHCSQEESQKAMNTINDVRKLIN